MPLVDLTESNPTRVGLSHPRRALAQALASGDPRRYTPHPLGLAEAREALSDEFRRSGHAVSPDSILLSASTSEAYCWLFKLLCDPGDAVAVPVPSYPLFEHLAGLEGIRTVPYRLRYDGRWHVDLASLRQALDRTSVRALVVVQPNNPTGSVLDAMDREHVVGACRDRRLALISDEVFWDTVLDPEARRGSLLGESRCLTFTLGGLSKSALLPQVKLAWTAVSGPPSDTAPAMERLEFVADCFLSASQPVQVALPSLLALGQTVRSRLVDRLSHNRERLGAVLARQREVTLLAAEGGWTAMVRVPALWTEDEWVDRLLARGVLVHPGYFYDAGEGRHLILSLLVRPRAMAQGAVALRACVADEMRRWR